MERATIRISDDDTGLTKADESISSEAKAIAEKVRIGKSAEKAVTAMRKSNIIHAEDKFGRVDIDKKIEDLQQLIEKYQEHFKQLNSPQKEMIKAKMQEEIEFYLEEFGKIKTDNVEYNRKIEKLKTIQNFVKQA